MLHPSVNPFTSQQGTEWAQIQKEVFFQSSLVDMHMHLDKKTKKNVALTTQSKAKLN